ncbi:ATP-dependent helicase [Candidatus Uhrbacteria bacterium]|nr:ATP-dependent helicase [Candidatus Uhrbacteria bacterium]
MADLLEGLNEAQRKAVTHKDGPLLIIAGAGTGKTTVIVRRFAWLVEQGLAPSSGILTLTFTEKAVRELEERVDQLLPLGHLDLHIHTFHGFCEWVLRKFGIEIGLAPDFEVLTEVDAWLFARRNMRSLPLDRYRPTGKETKFLRHILTHISRARDEGVTAEAYEACATKSEEHATTEAERAESSRIRELAKVYRAYEDLLHAHHALDFAGLIAATLRLLETRADILEAVRSQFPYLLVDEFQDTNAVQYKLVKLLAQPHNCVTVVGDDDQSIYRFRGASVENILAFNREYPEAERVVLTENYRSRQNILDAAYRFIQHNNPHRLESETGLTKKLSAVRGSGGEVVHWQGATLSEEARTVVDEILRLKAAGSIERWSDVGILARANDHAVPFAAELESRGIPFRFFAMQGLYQKSVILDVLAWMRVVVSPFRSAEAYRVLRHSFWDIPTEDLARVCFEAERQGRNLFETMQRGATELTLRGRAASEQIVSVRNELAELARTKRIKELFIYILHKGGIIAEVEKEEEAQKRQTYSYLTQMFERVKRFDRQSDEGTIQEFLMEFDEERQAGEAGALAGDVEEGPDVVRLLTVHSAKGLEFHTVFVVNVVDARFPTRERESGIPLPPELLSPSWYADDAHAEEERRLFYVACTRAKDRLYITSALDYGGARKKKPSRFIEEMNIPTDLIGAGDQGVFAFGEAQTPPNVTTTMTIPKYLSFTQLAAFERCPLQYKFAHLLRIPVLGNAHISYGKSVHKALENFTREWMKNNALPPVELLLSLYRECWIDEWYRDDDMRNAFRAKGEHALRTLFDEWCISPPEPFAVEQPFTLAFGGGILRGQIDRVDRGADGLYITDYKTGTPKTADALPREDRAQLYLYQWAAEELWHEPIARLSYRYMEDGSHVDFLGGQDDLDRVRERLRQTYKDIQSSRFSPKPNPITCAFCDFASICEYRAS